MEPLDSELDRLAKVLASDIASDEQQFHAVGPQLMTSGQLISLYGKLEERLSQYTQWQKLFMNLALWSPLSLVIGGLLLWIGLSRLGFFLLSFFPVGLLFSAIGIFKLYTTLGPLSNIDWMLEEVKTELNRRRQKKKK